MCLRDFAQQLVEQRIDPAAQGGRFRSETLEGIAHVDDDAENRLLWNACKASVVRRRAGLGKGFSEILSVAAISPGPDAHHSFSNYGWRDVNPAIHASSMGAPRTSAHAASKVGL